MLLPKGAAWIGELNTQKKIRQSVLNMQTQVATFGLSTKVGMAREATSKSFKTLCLFTQTELHCSLLNPSIDTFAIPQSHVLLTSGDKQQSTY